MTFKEKDKTNAQGVYGDTKLKGEMAIQSSGCRYLIMTTAWVFSEYGNKFFKTMLGLGAERDQLSIVNDQMGGATYAQDIAKVIVVIISQLTYCKNRGGLYNYWRYQPCTWYDFANKVLKKLKLWVYKPLGCCPR